MPFICPYCRRVFGSLIALRAHAHASHSKVRSEKLTTGAVVKTHILTTDDAKIIDFFFRKRISGRE